MAGFTLFEFVIAIIILGIAAALFTTFITPAARSADPMIMAQARAVATAHMDEILLRDFGDGSSCGSTTREDYDTIWCYDGLDDQPPNNQFGDPIAALDDYRVQVSVGDSPATIEVTVSHDSGTVDYLLESMRGDY